MVGDTKSKITDISAAPIAEACEDVFVKKPHSGISPIVGDVIGGVSSLVAGGVTAYRLTEERAYKNLSSLHLFKDMKEKRFRDGDKFAASLKNNEFTAAEANKKLKDSVKEFEKLSDEQLKKAGYESIFKKFGVLRSHQKWEVALTALAYGGVALGSVLLVTRGLFSQKEEEKRADKNAGKNDPGMER